MRQFEYLGAALSITGALTVCGMVGCSSVNIQKESTGSTQSATIYGPDYHFGVRCQNDFQNGWAPTINTYSQCDAFINTFTPSGETEDFYFNLHGAAGAMTYGNPSETCTPCGGTDSTQIFYLNTHGGVCGSNCAAYAMWNQNTSAYVQNMVLGSSLQAFISYACDTHEVSDGNFANRWGNAFSGGLKASNGAYDLVYDGQTDIGQDFSNYLEWDEETMSGAWVNAVHFNDNSNHPLGASTGQNATDCWNRHTAMTLAGMNGLSAIQGGSIGYYCWTSW
jgi:Family of unknown function (DUF6345)